MAMYIDTSLQCEFSGYRISFFMDVINHEHKINDVDHYLIEDF